MTISISRHRIFLTLSLLGSSFGAAACIEPPPKIPAIPQTGMALRVYVFGASAQDARRSFEAVKQNNPSFSVVNEGGDGELLVGLENDSPKCAPPTGLCSFRVAYRVRDKRGETLRTGATTVSASASRCTSLCSKALNDAIVKLVEVSAEALEQGPLPPGLGAKTASAKEPRPLCSVGAGPHLPSEEAEHRAEQVEALKRMSVLDAEDYQCLRKAYLQRL